MAACVTHPLDLVKVRLQTRAPDAPNTTISTFSFILRKEGPTGLYAGLTAALLRQLTYSTVRFGVYEDLKFRFAPKPDPNDPKKKTASLSLPRLILLSSAAGLLGGIAGNPGDVLNVRMQSDMSKPIDQRRNYKHALDGLIRMVREEGASSLFRGVTANSARAILMNSSQLASYDAIKNMFITTFSLPDNISTHFLSSLLAGFVATTICSPADVIKSRIMSAKGKLSLIGIVSKAQREEGLLWMFRGWTPSFIRLGPQTIFTMLFFEQHKKVYRSWKGLDLPGDKI
jgi:dicarboxylate transporter 10